MAANQKNIVVIGAGYGGITSALRLAKMFRRHSEYHIHLIDRNPFHTLKTQLHEAAVNKRDVTIDIGRIIQRYRVTFHLGEVTRIDFAERTIKVDDNSLSFGFVVLALGSQANFYRIPGLQENAFPLQTVSDARRIYDHISSLCAKASSETNPGQRKEMLRFVIGGGGLSGIEFAAELADHVAQCVKQYHSSDDEVDIIVVEAGDRILPSLDKSLTERIGKKLFEKNIKVVSGTRIVKQSPNEVVLSSNDVLRTRTLVWTGGIRIGDLAHESGMTTGESGRILVDEFLLSKDYPGIYAIGDNALAMNPSTGKPVPAAAQFALQQGRLVAQNIYADVFAGVKKSYRPRVWGEVISLGRHLAVGWVALPPVKKIQFIGFIGSLIKTAVKEKHIFLLSKESRNWISY